MEITNLIGADIDSLPYSLKELSVEKGHTTYFATDLENNYFYEPLEVLVITTDSYNKINSVSTDFDGLMDKKFYESIVENYGPPSNILKKKEVVSQESEILDGVVEANSTHWTLEEGKFSDHPIFVIWDKKDYKMVFTIQYELNRTELVVSKTNFSKG